MSLETKVMEEMKTAMKAKDQAALRSVRAIKAAILLAKTDGSHKEMTPEDEIKLLQKLVKQRQDSLAIYEEQGREDLAVVEREEIEVIQRFLPEQMSEEVLEAKLKDIIARTGAESMRDMGKVMGIASKEMAGRADGKTISNVVKRLLG
ncbi:MAG: GatB/YqeY domain-containing protein [Lewinella sp.]|nr:GatB/YqeY domain-containing protein [Lewinella sp.]